MICISKPRGNRKYLRSPAGVVVTMSKKSVALCFHEELYKLMLQM